MTTMTMASLRATLTGNVRGARAVALVFLGIGVIVAAPRAARADAYKDEKLGYSLNAPAKWKLMPIATDEHTLIAEWQCPRKFEVGDVKTNGWTFHEPKLDIVIIPNSAAEQKGGSITETDNKVIIRKQAAYRDLKDYLDKTAQDHGPGGYFFSKDAEELKVGDVKVLFYEITFDKFTSTYNSAPRKWYGWAFYGPDAIYGVVGDALVKFEEKIKPDLDAAVRSFKIFPRTGVLPGAEVTPGEDGADVVINKDPKKEHLTDDDLKKKRMEAFNRRLSRIKDSLAAGWKIKESDNFTAVTHCDDKFTKEVLDHAEALRAWLEQTLGFVGNGYAGKIILRCCADEDERSAMYKSMSWQDRCEVVTGQDKNGWMDNKLSSLNSGIYDIWLTDKNRELSWSLPPWIRWGLSSVIQTARSKGRKISDFKADTWDTVQISNLRRADKLLPARQFFSMGWSDMAQDYENMRQSEAFVRYLLTGSAHTNAKYKNVLADYLKNMAILIDERNDAAAKAADKPAGEEPKNEEEEAALRRARSESWKTQEQEILKKLLDDTFHKWEDKDWSQFNASYWKELGV